MFGEIACHHRLAGGERPTIGRDCARLPLELKLRSRQLKYLLKRTFADLLPPENVQRRKMGFGAPIGQWFRGPLQAMLRETICSPTALTRGYFQPQGLQSLLDRHITGQADLSFQLWNLLMLELWHREFIDH